MNHIDGTWHGESCCTKMCCDKLVEVLEAALEKEVEN
jgi:hypothetical protein